MPRVVTFGELMLRLAPEGYLRFTQTDRFGATFGGAEANTAVSLANFGIDSRFVTKLPDNPIGQSAVNSLRRYGVDTSCIARGGERIGIYYLEKGASQRSSICIYDRAHSSFQESAPGDYDWKTIFTGASWFHITGITPALGKSSLALCIEACKEAKKAGAVVSCDLNYRSRLWSHEDACKAMTQVCSNADICIANEADLNDVFGITIRNTDVENGRLDKECYVQAAEELTHRFGLKKTAITLRKSVNASVNCWSSLLYNGKESFISRDYEVYIIDRVGAGDSFAAGLIYALLSGRNDRDALEFAAAAGCLKHTVEGDFNMVSAEEVERLASGCGSGRIQR